MKILCVGYRDWALAIYDQLVKCTNHDIHIVRSKEEFDKETVFNISPEIILFYGWSWIVSDKIINCYKCVMLHPSPLPKYRGGSPIQNQILAGEMDSAVTLFLMTNGMDARNIIGQEPLSLEGSIPDIFKRMEIIGLRLTIAFLSGNYKEVPQDENEATYCKRRKSTDSEITINELLNKDSKYLYNKIRMLTGPYPRAFIRTIDNLRLEIIEASIEE